MTDGQKPNKPLFSQHYLEHRIQECPEWQVDVAAGFGALEKLYLSKKDLLPTLSEAQTEEVFIKPALNILGFSHIPQVTTRGKGRAERPDYALFTQVAPVVPQELPLVSADLQWRGYSEFADRPWTEPLTPDYDRVRSVPPWQITPSGWATRYGPVNELIAHADDGLAVIAGGDALTLKFTANLATPTSGTERDFFLFTIGWDKDADYHVAAGTTIAPLPWRGMDDQRHGIEPRPAFPSDGLHARYHTRWVGPRTYSRNVKSLLENSKRSCFKQPIRASTVGPREALGDP